MKHFGIYDTVEDAQDALNAGRLENDYVALVDGDLDYNSLTPEEPCVLGEWSDDGQGHYTFQILEPGDAVWENGVNIGSLMNVYFDGGQDAIDMDVTLATMPGSGVWTMNYVEPEKSANPSYSFEDGEPNTWDEQRIFVQEGSSSASAHIDWDGDSTFVFYSGDSEAPLTMTTINPECSE